MVEAQELTSLTVVRLRQIEGLNHLKYEAVSDGGERLATILPWFEPGVGQHLDMTDERTGIMYSVSRDEFFTAYFLMKDQLWIYELLLKKANLTMHELPND